MTVFEKTFDNEAYNYETVRPGYPDGLYGAIFDYAKLNEGS